MWYTNMYSNIILYQKISSDGHKSKLCYAQSVRELGSKGCGSPDLRSKWTWIGTLSLLRMFRQGPPYSPNTLLVRVQRLRNDLYKVVKGPSTKPLVLLMITGSYWQRRMRFTIFAPDEIKFASSLTLLSL